METPDALRPTFYSNPQLQAYWSAYGAQVGLLTSPPSAFEPIGEQMIAFLGPVRASILAGETFDTHWPARGPWQGRTTKEEGEEE